MTEPDRIVLVRHGETTYNDRGLLNGDPTLPVPLSPAGRLECEALRPALGEVAWAACFVTRFARTRESLALIVPGADARAVVLADLDDIDVGEFEGRPRADYRAWRRDHGLGDAPVDGESRTSAMARYGRGLRELAERGDGPLLVVTHDQPIRYAENALLGEHPVTGTVAPIPNARPYSYTRERLTLAAERLEGASRGEWPPS